MLYAFDRVLVEGTRRSAVLLAGAFALQALCSDYLLVFAAFALVGAALVRGPEWWQPHSARARTALLVAAAISVAAVGPFLWPYYEVSRDQGLVRSVSEVARYSAGWRDYLTTGGRLHYALWSHNFFEHHTALFPGLTALALAGLAILKGDAWRDPRARMALAFGAAGLVLSFGPTLPEYAVAARTCAAAQRPAQRRALGMAVPCGGRDPRRFRCRRSCGPLRPRSSACS